jgi:hypothetical protein
LDGISFQSSFLFTGLAAGPKTVTIKDVNNCISTTSTIVNDIAGPSLSLFDSINGCATGNIVATGLGGTAPYQYSIDGVTYQTSTMFPCLAVGTYVITVMDSNQCTAIAAMTLLGSQLPVSLLSFDATPGNNVVNIDWITASEKNNDYFTIEKSKEGKIFTPILVKDGAGNSTSILTYHDVDEHPFYGLSYYRLKQTDFDGTKTYSNIVPVKFESKSQQYYSYYNKADQAVHIIFTSKPGFDISIELHDMAGKLIDDEHELSGADLRINVPGISEGLYALMIKDGYSTVVNKIEIR